MKEKTRTLQFNIIDLKNKLKLKLNQITNPHLATMASFAGQPERPRSTHGLWYEITHDPVVICLVALTIVVTAVS